MNGKKVANGNELVNEISNIAPGTKAKVTYLRNGKPGDTTVTIADRAKLFSDRLGDDDDNNDQGRPKASLASPCGRSRAIWPTGWAQRPVRA